MNGSAPKRKGSTFERELVTSAIALGLPAQRAWGSDGRSLGMGAEVDLLVDGCGIQAKRRKSLPSYLTQPLEDPGVDAVAFREDRGQTYALVEWEWFLAMRKLIQEAATAEAAQSTNPAEAAASEEDT